MRALTLAVIAGVALGCSDMPSQPPSDADITGTWQWQSPGDPNAPAGPQTITWHLTAIGGAISGSGYSAWVNGPTPLTISGAIVGNEVELEITYGAGPTIPFRGHVLVSRALSGAEQFDAGNDVSIIYHRVD